MDTWTGSPAAGRPDRADVLAWLQNPPSTAGLRCANRDRFDFVPYDRLAEQVHDLASRLVAVQPGDVVAIGMSSGPSFVTALLAAMLAGGAPAPLPPPRFGQDLGRYADAVTTRLRSVRPRLMLTEPRLREILTPAAAAVGVLLACAEDLPKARPGKSFPVRDGLALVQFTSGSTGTPRPVRVSHRSLAANVGAIGDWLGIRPGDATASWLPVHHDMGLTGCLLTPIAHGSDVWLMSPEQFLRDPGRYIRCFGEYGATMTAMPPFGLEHVVRRVARDQLENMTFANWRTLIVGAQRISGRLLEEFTRTLGPYGFAVETLRPAYGLAEATLAVTGLPTGTRWTGFAFARGGLAPGEPVAEDPSARHLIVGCGTPLDQVTVTVCAPDGTELPERCLGEIVVGGASVTAGRHRTGDLGFLADGQLFVLGRDGDSVKVNGRSVIADDVEAALQDDRLPGHRLAVALGYDADRPTAVLVLEAATESEIARARDVLRRTTGCMRREVILAPRGTIPRTTSGKPRRAELWRSYMSTAFATLPRAVGSGPAT